MGRFETAAEFYKFREPYPARFFEEVAAKLGLSKRTRLLDVGCGPGTLAIGFSPFVGSATAIDIEPEMLRIAHEAAVGSEIKFVQTSVEDLQAKPGSFDFVTVGRALHWLSRERTLPVLEHVVAAGGAIAICGTTNTDAACNRWSASFREVRQLWSRDYEESKYRPDLDDWFSPSRFRRSSQVAVCEHYRLSVEDLVGRGLSFSVTSPSVLGDQRSEFESDIRKAIQPFMVDGWVEEEVSGIATIFE
jgi:SAM-dependent methyltransferase